MAETCRLGCVQQLDLSACATVFGEAERQVQGGSVERDTIEEVAAAMIAATPSGYVSVFVPGGQTVLGPYNRSALYFSCSSPATFIGFTLGAVYSYRPAACPGGLIGYSFTPDRTILADVMRCPTNTVLYNGTATDDASVFKQTSEGTSFGLRSRWYTCLVAGVINKPADGVCTTRWTDASMTALQKDPLDPDCGAGTCMLDGRCALK